MSTPKDGEWVLVPREPTEQERRRGVLEWAFERRAVRYEQRCHCLAYPCPNITVWFYIPSNSNLCMDCIEKREAALTPTKPEGGA